MPVPVMIALRESSMRLSLPDRSGPGAESTLGVRARSRGLDDLAALVVPAVRAHAVRQLPLVAVGADGSAGWASASCARRLSRRALECVVLDSASSDPPGPPARSGGVRTPAAPLPVPRAARGADRRPPAGSRTLFGFDSPRKTGRDPAVSAAERASAADSGRSARVATRSEVEPRPPARGTASRLLLVGEAAARAVGGSRQRAGSGRTRGVAAGCRRARDSDCTEPDLEGGGQPWPRSSTPTPARLGAPAQAGRADLDAAERASRLDACPRGSSRRMASSTG